MTRRGRWKRHRHRLDDGSDTGIGVRSAPTLAVVAPVVAPATLSTACAGSGSCDVGRR